MIKIRNQNNNIINYISKTEQYFLNQIELQYNLKKANPDDLIYLIKTKDKERISFLSFVIKEMSKGFDDGRYQRGY